MRSDLPRLVGISGPLQDQILTVDENGVRLSEDCLVRLCDGRVVAYSLRDGPESPWNLLDHNARIEAGSSEFRLELRSSIRKSCLACLKSATRKSRAFFWGW